MKTSSALTGQIADDARRDSADQIFDITEEVAERSRKLGVSTIRSVGDIARRQLSQDNDREQVTPAEMLDELRSDNLQLTGFLQPTHHFCEQHHDVGRASLIEVWIDQAERRTWFLREVESVLL